MGQKYHPLGLRLGLHRKWNTSWYSPTVTLSASSTFVSGAVLRRGGIRQGGRESLLQALITRAPRPVFSTPLSSTSGASGSSQISTEPTPRLLPVDLHIEIGSGGSLFFLFFYAKRREPGVAALLLLIMNIYSSPTLSSRIGSSTELLSHYSSRETLIYTGARTPKVNTLSVSERPFSLTVRGVSAFSASKHLVVESSFRTRSTFLRRFRVSRSKLFSYASALHPIFSSQRVVNLRSSSRRLGYAALLSPTNSRFTASWFTGLSSSSRHATPSSVLPVLSNLVGAPIHFLGVNALTLARYGRDQETYSREQTALSPSSKADSAAASPSRAFLRQRETERGSRYASVAAALPDLLRLTFLSLYLKKAPFLARVLAHSLTTLPRNRKETLFLRFLRKLVKVFASQRPERLGIRLRVQGRVNRWRRTKHRVGEMGRLPLYSYSARLEYGEAQALTRKGALGFRLWFAYHPGFAHRYRRTLLSYLRQSARLVLLFFLKMFQPQPRHFRKPNRHAIRSTYEHKSNRLRFGRYGLQALEPGFLTARQLESIRRGLAQRLKRKGKLWLRALPDYPRTAKPKEVRRGRGKGAVDH